jgi:hypothetical protein
VFNDDDSARLAPFRKEYLRRLNEWDMADEARRASREVISNVQARPSSGQGPTSG